MSNAGLIDLLGEAVVDRKFRSALISNPGAIIGKLDLTSEERQVIVSIRASSFEDFAAQIYAWMVGQCNGYGTVCGHEEIHLSELRPMSIIYSSDPLSG